MNNSQDLRKKALELAAFGVLSEADLYAVNDMTRQFNESPIKDVDGNPLKVDSFYLNPKGIRFRITKWVHDSGNILETYYRVYGISSISLSEEVVELVEVKYQGGLHNPTYQSKLKPE